LLPASGRNILNALLTPQISKLHATQNITNLQQTLTRTAQIKFSCSLVAILILGFSGDTILGWFGEDFTAGYTSLLLLAGGQLIITAVGPVDLLLNLTRHQDRCMVAFSSALLCPSH
jgi:O-antigen/teichoic acid export membrane protein